MLERDPNKTGRNRSPPRNKSDKYSLVRVKYLTMAREVKKHQDIYIHIYIYIFHVTNRPIRLEEGGFRIIVTKKRRGSNDIRFIFIE